MNFKKMIDTISTAACIISVEKLENDTYGDIRIVEANPSYITQTPGFIPGILYSDLVPKDMKFEDYCYRAAVKKQRMHAYVETKAFNAWVDQSLIPLVSEDEGIGYCLFVMELTEKADPIRRADVSIDVANEVIRTCIKLRGANNFIAAVPDCIKDIRKLCDADSCCLLSVDWKLHESTLLAADLKDNPITAIPEPEKQAKEFHQVVETWPDTIGYSDCIIVQDEKQMQDLADRNPVWAASLISAHVSSIVLFPLVSSKKTVGYIWATNFDLSKVVQIKETLELTSFFLASELSNYNLLKELEYISNTDMLTGVFNRNAMNYYVDCFVRGVRPDTFGIAYTDLNGLKRANDVSGHVAGDKLLKNAARVLQEVFPDACVYRAGGDEFVVISENITEDDFIANVRRLKKRTSNPDVLSLAIGSYYGVKSSDIRDVMRIADQRMYEDKKHFYELHPDFAR